MTVSRVSGAEKILYGIMMQASRKPRLSFSVYPTVYGCQVDPFSHDSSLFIEIRRIGPVMLGAKHLLQYIHKGKNSSMLPLAPRYL